MATARMGQVCLAAGSLVLKENRAAAPACWPKARRVSTQRQRRRGRRRNVDQGAGRRSEIEYRMAQLWLIPLRMKDPTALARSTAGELLSTVWPDERGTDNTSLWFCTMGGTPAEASWAKLARQRA